MTDRVILWCPAGRRANMELLLPFLRRILDEHPETELHIWDLARDPADHEWLSTVWGDRITLVGDFYGHRIREAFVKVYLHYADRQYRGAVFVKCDDDILFIETGRFAEFLAAIRYHADAIVSADTVNNGACATLNPCIAAMFPDMASIPLEAFESVSFARASHDFFFDEWTRMVGQPVAAQWVQDYLSINLIGYTWRTGVALAQGLNTRPPKQIAGRKITQKRMGDEGMANMLPRIILKGFTAAHLSFQPQHGQLPESYWQGIRDRYKPIGKQYLEAP